MHIKVTDNEELVAEIRQKLQENDNYCPSKKEKNPDTRCICKKFIDMPETGVCECGLYKKLEV